VIDGTLARRARWRRGEVVVRCCAIASCGVPIAITDT